MNADGTRSVFCDLNDEPVDAPARPSDTDMVKAVASAFNVDYTTALDWMESIDFHELNR